MKKLNKLLSVVLALLMTASAFSMWAVGTSAVQVLDKKVPSTSDSAVLVMCSDYQALGGNTKSTENVKSILTRIVKDYPSVDGFVCGGDYDFTSGINADAGISSLKKTVKDVYATLDEKNMYFVQGNHDTSGGYNVTGKYDGETYGLYLIDEDDYAAESKDHAKITATATKLGEYLEGRLNSNPTQPVFVCTHVPLHFSTRTIKNEDAIYASEIVSVLNKYGDSLNIIFLFGHDHAWGDDDYLGGSSVFIKKGETIRVAKNGSNNYSESVDTEIKFTYMNYGYVGYYWGSWTDSGEGTAKATTDSTLTMTTFEIVGNEVTVSRWDSEGVHLLKSEGKKSANGRKVSGGDPCIPNTTTYASPVKVGINGTDVGSYIYSTSVGEYAGFEIKTNVDTSFSVDKKEGTNKLDGIEKYFIYDIKADSFKNGEKAEISIPASEEYSAVFYKGDKLEKMDAKRVGDKLVFTTTHFSEFVVAKLGNAEENLKWTEKITVLGGTIHKYVLDTDGLDNGKEYLIVAETETKALKNSTEPIDVEIIDNIIILENNSFDWTYIVDSDNKQKFKYDNGEYLGTNETGKKISLSFDSLNDSCEWTITQNNGKYRLVRPTNNYLRFNSGSWEIKNNTGKADLRLFEYKPEEIQAETYYLAMTDIGDQTFSTTRFSNKNELEKYLKSVINVYKSADKSEKSETDYTLSASENVIPGTVSNVDYTVKVGDDTVGTFKVSFAEKTLTGSECKKSGTVLTYCEKNQKTGATITLTYDDGSTETVDVTLDMLSGTFDTKNSGVYKNLTANYNGNTFNGFTLTVNNDPKKGDYPEYPNGGSVKVTKNGTGIDFQSTGIAKIELTASGITVNKGVDVIVMIDTSSSMVKNKTPDGVTRGKVMADSMIDLIADLSKNEDGSDSDVRMAIARFNGYTLPSISSSNKLSSSVESASNNGKVYTGDKTIGVNAFEYAKDIDSDALFGHMNFTTTSDNPDFPSGTNYDYAFDTVYRLGSAIKAQNAKNGEERDLYVIFMTDGAAFQYNYFAVSSTFGSTPPASDDWNGWLNGEFTENSYYNGSPDKDFKYIDIAEDGETVHKHWMAEAIKGSPDENYPVIDPTKSLGVQSTNARVTGFSSTSSKSYMRDVPGLGAIMYTIGFCIYDDHPVSGATTDEEKRDHSTQGARYSPIIKNVTHLATYDENTGKYLYFDADKASDLDSVFNNIAGSIKYAATQAYYEDTMGAAFDLALDPIVMLDDVGRVIADENIDDNTTYITVTRYELNEDGTRNTTTLEELEKVWKENGKVKSSKLSSDNILSDGVICAKTFYYNTTKSSKTVDGITIAPETFYWKIGTIDSQEIVLTYFVYLTGALEGEAKAGSYSTNESADLFYINWLNHDASQSVNSPALAWQSASVSYGFYLVNEEGKPVVNQTTGQTGSFAQAIKVTNAVLYKTVLLNSADEISSSIVAADVLPNYYTLFDPDASYYVFVNSTSGSGTWTITEGEGTTYVTDFNGNLYTNLSSSEYHADEIKDYTHTTVWFAVKYIVACYPDTVVIDYGIPVAIDVLNNDMFGTNGTLNSIFAGNTVPEGHTEELNSGFRSEAEGLFGTASIENGKVVYTPGSMQMNGVDTFVYAVYYDNGNASQKGYYYGMLTVVPATVIYYEESFVDFAGYWEDEGEVSNGRQSEDRPGYYSLSAIDANNVYGYDPAYMNFNLESYGLAKKTTVPTEGAKPYATFTFTGTGFDIISRTDSTTGLVIVEISNAETGYNRKLAVDTYYGFNCTVDGYIRCVWVYGTDGLWHRTDAEKVDNVGTDGEEFPTTNVEVGTTVIRYVPNYSWVRSNDGILYQIPVLKSGELDYGTYTVTVTPTYTKLFAHDNDNYSFYLDAIRVYNPAKNDSKANEVYSQDNEANPEFVEIRDILLGAQKFTADEDIASGIVFIDGFGNTTSVSDYELFGPKNETYLKENQAIAFKLNKDSYDSIASVQIAAKDISGNSTMKIEILLNGMLKNEKTILLTTATDLYYDILSLINSIEDANRKDAVVVVRCSSGIVSLTNIKFTFKTEVPSDAKAMLSITPHDVKYAEMFVENEATTLTVVIEKIENEEFLTDEELEFILDYIKKNALNINSELLTKIFMALGRRINEIQLTFFGVKA